MSKELMDRAVEIFGSERKLGLAIGYTQHGVNRARRSGRVTPQMAMRIDAVTNGKIAASMLCSGLIWQNKKVSVTRRRRKKNGGQ